MRGRKRRTLKEWRRERDLTLKELGDAVGVSYVTIHGWENYRSEPRASDIAKLEKALGIKWSDDVLYNANNAKSN